MAKCVLTHYIWRMFVFRTIERRFKERNYPRSFRLVDKSYDQAGFLAQIPEFGDNRNKVIRVAIDLLFAKYFGDAEVNCSLTCGQMPEHLLSLRQIRR